MRTPLLIICCIAIVSCSKTEEVPEIPIINFVSTTVSNIPAAYEPFFSAGLGGEKVKAVQSRLPFETISIRRTGCFGTCPVYEMVLHRDGKAELNAQQHLPKLGKFIGEFNFRTYGRLCYFIENSHFTKMNANYKANWTDSSTCIVTVASEATAKAVSDYGGVGPIELWAIQELLDAIKNEIEWEPAR